MGWRYFFRSFQRVLKSGLEGELIGFARKGKQGKKQKGATPSGFAFVVVVPLGLEPRTY